MLPYLKILNNMNKYIQVKNKELFLIPQKSFWVVRNRVFSDVLCLNICKLLLPSWKFLNYSEQSIIILIFSTVSEIFSLPINILCMQVIIYVWFFFFFYPIHLIVSLSIETI
jgi:hypothetical protein